MIFKRKREVERLSDVDTQMMSKCNCWCYANNTPTGTFIFLKYLYGKNEVLPKMQKNQTPEMKIKPQFHHHHKPEVSKVQLRPKNWNANPGKNESRQKYRFR